MWVFIATFLLLFSTNAVALNKCLAPSGEVTFQDAPCGSDQKASGVKIWQNTPSAASGAAGVWRFERRADDMTGAKSCVAFSPSTAFFGSGYRDVSNARLVVVAHAGGLFSVVVKLDAGSKNILHNDVDGMGVRVQPGAFHDLSQKLGQGVVAPMSSSALIDDLISASGFRLRLRFWPYDKLHDSDVISTAGVRQAIALAAGCAKDH